MPGDRQDRRAERTLFEFPNIFNFRGDHTPPPIAILAIVAIKTRDRSGNLVTHLGGPPESFLVKDGAVVPLQDHYPEAALNEAISVFNRARKGVVLADLYAFGTTLIAGEESPIKWKSDIVKSLMIPATQGSFWEHAETAYIRIASFWDRLGQILDFSYFNIRQFDRNGFSAVIDRIYSNVIPMNKRLADNRGWKAVRKFQTNETEDGLKWLRSVS